MPGHRRCTAENDKARHAGLFFVPPPEAAFQRGRLLQNQHRLTDAIACYKQAISLDGQHVPSYLMLSLCWMQTDGNEENSVDAARRAGLPRLTFAAQIPSGGETR